MKEVTREDMRTASHGRVEVSNGMYTRGILVWVKIGDEIHMITETDAKDLRDSLNDFFKEPKQ